MNQVSGFGFTSAATKNVVLDPVADEFSAEVTILIDYESLFIYYPPCMEAGKNTSTVIPASRKRRRKGNRISLRRDSASRR
jgi:hypothetical protein